MKTWLGSFALAAAVALALAVPLTAALLPPLVDYPNHLARAVVLHDPSQPLASFYSVEWAVLPNLAMDVVMAPLLALFEPFLAGRVFLWLLLVSNVLAVVAYHRAAFGVFSWWPFAAALVAYNATFLMGFLNFQVGLSVVFAGAALWLRLSPGRPVAAMLVLAACGAVAFFCHLVAVVFLFLLVGAEELASLLPRRRENLRSLGLAALRRFAWLGLALLPALALYLLSPLSESTGSRVSWFGIEQRPARLFAPFANHDRQADVAVGLLVIGVAGLLLATRRAILHPGAVVAALLCLGLYVVVPFGAATGAWLDIRFPILLGFLLFAGLRPTLAPRLSMALGAALGVLLVVRMTALASEWARGDRFVQELRQTIAEVPPGARVAALWVRHVGPERQPMAPIGMGGLVSYTHLPALLVIDRDAFWPGLFAIRGQQPIVLQPPYGGFPSTVSGMLPTLAILDPQAPQPGPRQQMAAPLWADWPERFDYILVLGAYAVPDLSAVHPDRLSLVFSNRAGALLRVRSGGLAPQAPASP